MAVRNVANLTSKIEGSDGQKVEVSNNSNIHIASKVDTDVVITKTAEKLWGLPKDTLKITTTITNNANENIFDLNIKDTLSEGATFKAGSVKIGSVEREELNPIDGFMLDVTIQAQGGELDMTYDVVIDEYPDVDEFKNSSSVSLNVDNKEFNLSSNELTISILSNDVTLFKTANTVAVKSGDVLTYTIAISNTGSLKNTELFFTDQIPDGTTFVPDSVTIDNESKAGYNPTTGFNLNDLDVGDTITITFQVNVN